VATKIIESLSDHMLSAGTTQLPKEVTQKAKDHILDTIAAIVSGSRLKPGTLGIQLARDHGGTEQCSVLGSRVRATAATAAFANGMCAHADETDDSISQLHPGCAIVPAALAMAELLDGNGAKFLNAVVLGYDIGYRFHKAFAQRSTSFGATFGAAAAAGSLAVLDLRQTRFLISYAGQQASGSRAWVGDDEHVEKAFDYAAMPARNGVTAALLVRAGFTGNPDILEGDNNLMTTYPPCDADELLRNLGQRHDIARTGIKKYSVGSPMMEAVDAMAQLVGEQKIQARDVVKVVARIFESGARTVNNRSMPDVNVQYILSAILLDGKLTFEAAHDIRRMKEQELLDVKERVHLIADPELEGATIHFQSIVEVILKDGKTLRKHVIKCRGRPDNPMSPEEVERKATPLMEPVLGGQRTRQVIETVRGLESLASIRDLTRILMPDGNA
jgi:2-methylcitrate dehydratase PrpD